jgi:hypothetical protein
MGFRPLDKRVLPYHRTGRRVNLLNHRSTQMNTNSNQTLLTSELKQAECVDLEPRCLNTRAELYRALL